MITREKFVAKAIRDTEKALCAPAGWWGKWQHLCGPNGVEVKYMSNGGWKLIKDGLVVSKHDSRTSAVNKGRRLSNATTATPTK